MHVESYDGEWAWDRREGEGSQQFKTGDSYTGGWKGGKFHGRGVYLFNSDPLSLSTSLKTGASRSSSEDNFNKYSGEYENGLRHGEGTMEYMNHDQFKGEWFQNNKRKGTLTMATGDVYEGEFDTYSGRYKEGFGTLTKADGTIEHEGRWLKDSPVKEGEYTTSNMRIGEMGQYDGTIKDGKFHANGKYQERNMKNDVVYAYDGEYNAGLKSGNGREKIAASNELYIGDFLQDQRHGFGQLTYTYDDDEPKYEYQGGFQEGKKSGKGHEKHYSQSNKKIIQSYQGDYANGLYDGSGVLEQGGSTYQGEFRAGKKFGSGVLKHSDGSSYSGSFDNDKYSGEGTLVFSDGSSYTGTWSNGQKNGLGKWTSKEGIVLHEGSFVDDQPSLVGEYYGQHISEDGSVYLGHWLDGREHGKGERRTKDGDIYMGDWSEGRPHGQGVRTYANGDRYEGPFRQGMASGEGVKTFVNGSIYTGAFRDDGPYGQGEQRDSNGDTYKGEWRDGLRNGYGVQTLNDGKIVYTGQWKDGVVHGTASYTNAETGESYEGQFADGQKHGTGVYRDTRNGGSEYRGEFLHDKFHGQGTYSREIPDPSPDAGKSADATAGGESVANEGDVLSSENAAFRPDQDTPAKEKKSKKAKKESKSKKSKKASRDKSDADTSPGDVSSDEEESMDLADLAANMLTAPLSVDSTTEAPSAAMIRVTDEGSFMFGLLNGHATRVHNPIQANHSLQGMTYQGSWKDDFYHGRGSETTKDGEVLFDGSYVHGKRDYNSACQTTVTLDDGSSYTGWCEHGVPVGNGTRIDPATGDKWEGLWSKDGTMVGKLVNTMGEVWEGTFTDCIISGMSLPLLLIAITLLR